MQKSKWDMTAVKRIASKGLVVSMNGADDLMNQGPEQLSVANKFGNIITEIDGFKFRSKLEGNRYLQLKMMNQAGLIHEFKKQVPYDLYVEGVYITRYIADFVVTYPDGTVVVEDTKGVETEAFKIKKNLMLATLGIEIQIIRNIKSNNNGTIKNRKKGTRLRR